MPQIESLCKHRVFDNPEEAQRHAVGCTLCRAVARVLAAAGDGPAPNTVNVRGACAARIIRNAEILVETTERADEHDKRIVRLSMIIAAAEQALFFETRGRVGSEHANSESVLEARTHADV